MNTYPAQQDELQKQEAIKNAAAIGAFVGVFVKPLVLMLLWNWLMPGLFGLATIGYFKSLGLYALSSLLFKNAND